jgi:hypothetical protein
MAGADPKPAQEGLVTFAVLDLKPIGIHSVYGAEEISAQVRQLFSRSLEFEVLGKEPMAATLRDQGFALPLDCQGPCAQRIGYILDCSFVVTGSLTKSDYTYTLNIYLYNAGTGGLVSSEMCSFPAGNRHEAEEKINSIVRIFSRQARTAIKGDAVAAEERQKQLMRPKIKLPVKSITQHCINHLYPEIGAGINLNMEFLSVSSSTDFNLYPYITLHTRLTYEIGSWYLLLNSSQFNIYYQEKLGKNEMCLDGFIGAGFARDIGDLPLPFIALKGTSAALEAGPAWSSAPYSNKGGFGFYLGCGGGLLRHVNLRGKLGWRYLTNKNETANNIDFIIVTGFH